MIFSAGFTSSLSRFVGFSFISLVKLKVFDDFASRITAHVVKFEFIVKLREDFLQLLQGYDRIIVFKDLSCPYFEDFLVVDSLVILPPERENFAFVREDFHGLLVTVGVVTHVAEGHGHQMILTSLSWPSAPHCLRTSWFSGQVLCS